jgi:hypothetical protein
MVKENDVLRSIAGVRAANVTPTNGRKPRWKDDKLVRVQFRNGDTATGTVGKWRWEWGGRFPDDYEFDVVAVEAVK